MFYDFVQMSFWTASCSYLYSQIDVCIAVSVLPAIGNTDIV